MFLTSSSTKALQPCLPGLTTRLATGIRLGVVDGRMRINPITPDVGPKFGQREARVMSDNTFAEVWAWLARTPRAQVQVVDIDPDRVSEQLPFSGFGCLEKRLEIHVATNQSKCVANIDQKDLRIKLCDLLLQIFLHVDQND
jgi:hypothetical protein